MSKQEALDYNILRASALENKISEQEKQLQEFLSETLDVLYKLQVRSLLDYSLPVFYNSLSAKQKVRLDKIQYTAAKIVTGALHFTSKEKLYDELGWETIQSKTEFLGLSLSTKLLKTKQGP